MNFLAAMLKRQMDDLPVGKFTSSGAPCQQNSFQNVGRLHKGNTGVGF
jgi:hypothetical protein